MDSGYYAAMTGLVARTQALDTAAANLANAQTPGYRAEREFFRSAVLLMRSIPNSGGRWTTTVFWAATGSAWRKARCSKPAIPGSTDRYTRRPREQS
jgi:flagellar basal body rod protein FlgG